MGVDLARDAAQLCYKTAGLKPSDVDVVELHDCFSPNELFLVEQLGFAAAGEGARLLQEGRWMTREGGGQQLALGPRGLVVNPSGGLETKGHPIGATGEPRFEVCFEERTETVAAGEREREEGEERKILIETVDKRDELKNSQISKRS